MPGWGWYAVIGGASMSGVMGEMVDVNKEGLATNVETLQPVFRQ
jgi:hypothetical protein